MTAFGSVSALARGFGFVFCFGRFFYSYFGDAVALQVVDGEAAAFVFEGVAQLRDALQPGQNKSGQSFEASLTRESQAIGGFQVADVDRSLEQQDRLIF